MTNNAESEAQGIRRAEGLSDQRPNHSDGEEGIGNDGFQHGGITVGTTGAAWQGASLAGGILASLIEDTEVRLSEARECIAWYQREEEKQLTRLRNLRELEKLED